jgi:hypothetical protein
LAIRILDELFWFRLSVHCLSERRYIFNEEMKNVVKDEEEKDE